MNKDFNSSPSISIPKEKPLSNKNTESFLVSHIINFEEKSPCSSPNTDSPGNQLFGKSPSPKSFRRSMNFGSPRRNATVDAIDLSQIFGKEEFSNQGENKENFM